MPIRPATKLYEMGRQHREANAEKPREIPADLIQPESKTVIRPMGREVSEDELRVGLQKVFDTNKWIAFTHRNVDLISKTFLFDERLSPQHSMQDLIEAVKIVDREQRLDRTPPPPKPTFPDDPMEPLSDGSMPLPLDSTPQEQRRASLVQMKNLVGRLKRQELWQRQQDNGPQEG